jgi:hypothetical protein
LLAPLVIPWEAVEKAQRRQPSAKESSVKKKRTTRITLNRAEVAYYRALSGCKQQDIADALGVTPALICYAFRGLRTVSLENARRIALQLNAPLSELVLEQHERVSSQVGGR